MKHNLKDVEYCVAIRTLGLAGNKFQQELISLVNQTIPPKKILVYILIHQVEKFLVDL